MCGINNLIVKGVVKCEPLSFCSKIARRQTWCQVEASNVTRHSAESMRNRLQRSIVHRLPQLLASRGGAIPSPRTVRQLRQRLMSQTTFSPETLVASVIPETELNADNTSLLTSDSSVHDNDPENGKYSPGT